MSRRAGNVGVEYLREGVALVDKVEQLGRGTIYNLGGLKLGWNI